MNDFHHIVAIETLDTMALGRSVTPKMPEDGLSLMIV
jgi:hypothetical protein